MRRSVRWSVAGLFLSTIAFADPATDAQRKRAAQAFDAAVAHVNHAEFEEAAKGFLLADDLAPNSLALSNAMAAARKANDDLLVARAAQRAIDRADTDDKLATSARVALLDVEHRLARVDLSCDPMPCTLKVDDETVQPGKTYVLPGTHSAQARGNGGAVAAERLTVADGGHYHVVLYPTSPTAVARRADVRNDAAASSNAASSAPPPSAAPTTAPKSTPDGEGKKPLPPAVVIVGGAVTVVLAGVLTWSGLNTLSAKNGLGNAPTQSAIDDVKSKETRSNILLASTLVVGVATAVVAVTLVDWGSGSASASLAPVPGGAHLGLSGHF